MSTVLLALEASNTEAWHKAAAQWLRVVTAAPIPQTRDTVYACTQLGHLWDHTGSSGLNLHKGLFLTLLAEKYGAQK